MPIPSTPSIMPNVLGYAADTVQIPETTPTGQGIPSFRDLFPFITQVDPDAGGVMVERAWMNALFNLLGQHAFFQQSGCVYPWQATLNYITGSHVKGSDDVEYIALQPSGPDVSGTGAKDPAQQANRAYWVSLASFVSGDFVPDSRRVIAGTGLTGGGPLSSDVTLAAKLDGKTTQAAADGAITVKDVAIEGDIEDLASARGQVGNSKTQGSHDFSSGMLSEKPGMYTAINSGSTNVPFTGPFAEMILGTPTHRGSLLITSGRPSFPRAAISAIDMREGGGFSGYNRLITEQQVGDGLTVNNGIISVPEYEGATASAAGTSGLVPPAAAGQHESFLTGGGEYKPALSTGGGVMTGSIQINDLENAIGAAPSTNTERGLFLGDKNSVIMGGFDVIQRASDNAKYTQFYSKNSSGHITSIAAVTYEDGTRELVADSPLQINDIQIKQVVDGGRRVIVLSGARGKEGYSFRFSPDTGEAYMDGRVIHAKADTAGYADTAGSANALGGKAESALSVAFASEAQNAFGLKGMDMIIVKTTHTLPNYGTWKYMYLVATDEKWIDMVIGESPGGTTLTPNYPGYPDAFMDGMAFRSA